MNYRALGHTSLQLSEISFGTWTIGGDWGNTDDIEALRALQAAMDAGVNFFDTADVYGMGHSEELLAKATQGKEHNIHIATKFCRSGDILNPATYSETSIRHYLEGSLRRLKRDYVDIYQIHCPPMFILKDGSVFEVLEKLMDEGKIRYYGVSVETVEEGIYTIEHSNAKALQVIFNLFRQKPIESLFPLAKQKGVGILARLPLASGLLTGKFTPEHRFSENDHRNFNEHGEKFNVGETFAGLGFVKGVELAEQVRWIAENRGNMTRAALRWILDFDAVTCAIPGFRTTAQVEDNLKSLEVPSFSKEEHQRLGEFYRIQVQPWIRGAY